jgi:hypothetical protein
MSAEDNYEYEDNDDFEIEVEDDTPEEDRGREPMPPEIVDTLDKDELEEYDDTVKQKLKQYKKVWHDERRAKEQADRERQEAITVAKQLIEENKKLKSAYSTGEKEYISTSQQAAKMEVEAAKRAYREAYESGDTDGLIEAQEQLQLANLKVIRANNLRETPLQDPEDVVQRAQQEHIQAPQPDKKALAWYSKNQWFNQDPVMTATAHGIDQKLRAEGVDAGSDAYYRELDRNMRSLFSDYFGEPKGKPPTVVAPASRSTSPRKVKLSSSQVQLAKKLGISPEDYAKAVLKLEM